MNSLGRFLLCVLYVALTASLLFAEENSQEKKLTKQDLPAAVLAAFEKDYPKVEIKTVSTETEDSLTFFEIESAERSILYTANGKIHEIEEPLALKDLPKVVTDSLSMRCAKGKPVRASKITRGAATEYEITMTCPKHTKEVLIDASGHVLKMEVISEKEE